MDRIARDFQTNGLQLTKQTMSNWTIWAAERYFQPVYNWMKKLQHDYSGRLAHALKRVQRMGIAV